MKILVSFLLVFCFVMAASAQERVIDKPEFDSALAEGHNHSLRWKGEKYRMTVTTSSKVAGRPQTDYSSKMIFEYGPSIETRTVTTSAIGDQPAKTTEVLRIGDSIYMRSASDAWTRKEYAPPQSTGEKEESPLKIISSQAEYRYLGQGTWMNRPVSVYVKTERKTMFDQKTGTPSESESKSTYWVDSKGTILKSEFRSEHRGANTSQTSVITQWEPDPSITFTAPEIVP